MSQDFSVKQNKTKNRYIICFHLYAMPWQISTLKGPREPLFQ